MKFNWRTIPIFFLLALPGSFTNAQVQLPLLVSNGMVLQRDHKIKIWGWAGPQEAVQVKFNGKTYKSIATPDKKWAVLLPPIKAGGPYQMQIDASNHLEINDILIGDVWFCSGQSNMVLPMERVKEKYPEEIRNADYPQIRNFFIPTVADVTQLHEDLPAGKWMPATAVNVLGFGAASYFFAKKLYEQYHVPIGLINSSVGGTPIEAWMSEDGIKQFPADAKRLIQIRDTAFISHSTKHLVAREKTTNELDKGLNGAKTWYDTTYVPHAWHPYWLPGYWADQGIKGLNGVVWFRKEIDLPLSAKGKPAKLYMGRIVDADNIYVNGILIGSTTYQYPPRRYTIVEGILQPGKNIIVIKVVNEAGKGGFVPDKPYYLFVDDEKIDLRGDWQYKVGQVFHPTKSNTNNFSMQNEPTGLFNTMVAPIIDFPIKGVLWYQGEANTFKPKEYGFLLPALINDWRSKWNQPDLPFIYAQLPGFMEVQYSPAESQWAELREKQLKSLSVPYTGMAVTIDGGEWNDIHPLNKKLVGDRLALLAERVAYGDKQVTASGPLYQSAEIKGNKVIISFTNIGTGLIVKDGTGLTQFAIAGADQKFVWANAIIENNKVIVWNNEIKQPLYVRYAWADNPDDANLYNKEGLPASPFTTETTSYTKL